MPRLEDHVRGRALEAVLGDVLDLPEKVPEEPYFPMVIAPVMDTIPTPDVLLRAKVISS